MRLSREPRWLAKAITIFKYVLSVLMMISGVVTAFSPLTNEGGRLDWIYSSRPTLVIFGIYFFISGLLLFIGLRRRKKFLVSKGLMLTYIAFLFSAILNSIALQEFDYINFIISIIVAFLYIRWRLIISYIDPKRFSNVVNKMKDRSGS